MEYSRGLGTISGGTGASEADNYTDIAADSSTGSAHIIEGKSDADASEAVLSEQSPDDPFKTYTGCDNRGYNLDAEHQQYYAKREISAEEAHVDLSRVVMLLFERFCHDLQALLVSKKSHHELRGGVQALLKQGIKESLFHSMLQLSKPETQRIGLLVGTPSQMIMWPTTDTDGPAGCFALTHVLVEMGKKVLILTDDTHFGQLHPALLRTRVRDPRLFDRRRQSIMRRYPVGDEWGESHDSALEVTFGVLDHIVNVGRLGPAKDQQFYANTGHLATHHETQFCNLFRWAEASKKQDRRVYTTTLGELGNELGMLPVREAVISNLEKGEQIGCVQAADNVVVATSVNWGAFGLAAALAVYHAVQRKAKSDTIDLESLLPDEEENQKVLITLVDEAARCGISGTRDLWVDKYPLKKQAKMIRRINETAKYYYSLMVEKLSDSGTELSREEEEKRAAIIGEGDSDSD